jgi:hypothetical protein
LQISREREIVEITNIPETGDFGVTELSEVSVPKVSEIR